MAFDLEVRVGAGAYICGEETSMLESLEGKRGMVRAKPPLPALKGLFGKPTVVNNVLTLASVPVILAEGAEYLRDFGVGRSRGTQAFQLAGNIKRGGIVEKAFGITLGELSYDFGGGTASGRPSAPCRSAARSAPTSREKQFDLPMDYEAFAAVGAMVGHGGVVVSTTPSTWRSRRASRWSSAPRSPAASARPAGSAPSRRRGDRPDHRRTRPRQEPRAADDLCETMADGSLCAMGGLTPMPVRSAIKHFPEDFDRPPTASAAE